MAVESYKPGKLANFVNQSYGIWICPWMFLVRLWTHQGDCQHGIVLVPTPSPRPPLPLSATLTEEEAARIIQSYYRGYVARKESGAQLFR